MPIKDSTDFRNYIKLIAKKGVENLIIGKCAKCFMMEIVSEGLLMKISDK